MFPRIVEDQALLTLNGYATGVQVKGMKQAEFYCQAGPVRSTSRRQAVRFTADQVAIGRADGGATASVGGRHSLRCSVRS